MPSINPKMDGLFHGKCQSINPKMDGLFHGKCQSKLDDFMGTTPS
jgi:hypothetical protein